MNTSLRRLAAFATDLGIVLASVWVLEPIVSGFVRDIRSWPVAALPAIVLMGSFAARGTSPGKRLTGIEIRAGIALPGLGKGFAREMIRFLSLPIFVLPVLYLVQWHLSGTTPYDRFLGLAVGPRSADRSRP